MEEHLDGTTENEGVTSLPKSLGIQLASDKTQDTYQFSGLTRTKQSHKVELQVLLEASMPQSHSRIVTRNSRYIFPPKYENGKMENLRNGPRVIINCSLIVVQE